MTRALCSTVHHRPRPSVTSADRRTVVTGERSAAGPSAVGDGAAAIPLVHSYLRTTDAAQATAGQQRPPLASTTAAGTQPAAR